ncbi:ragulator complex protein LAMTOR1 [Drosophila tropicalis]|uniref:ragulator complex protein LAMTOR1 n=1 Tax=Drosophila tropicalis TaxID=46794 RepID=UPI0035ABCF8B
MEYVRSIWTCVASICTCWQCNEDLGTQGIEPTERTHLLADTENHSPALRRSNSVDLNNDYSQSLPKKDDQNALSRLVQNTAINMINVSAMDCQNLEHQEYTDRIKLYSQRMQQIWNNVQHPGVAVKGLLKDVPNHQFYASKPIFLEDTNQMKWLIEKSHGAVLEIQIDHKESVVVPFRIP